MGAALATTVRPLVTRNTTYATKRFNYYGDLVPYSVQANASATSSFLRIGCVQQVHVCTHVLSFQRSVLRMLSLLALVLEGEMGLFVSEGGYLEIHDSRRANRPGTTPLRNTRAVSCVVHLE